MINCKSCKMILDLEYFRFSDLKKLNKKTYKCIDCLHIEYVKKSDNKKQYYIDNKEYILQQRKEYRIKNLDKLIIKNHKYYDNNKEKILKQKSEYGKLNKNKINKYKKEKRKEKIKNNPILKLRFSIASKISSYFKKIKINKTESILNNVPWALEELRTHLESLFEPWMNWNNHGKYSLNTWNDNDSTTWKWQLDHIIPQSKFHYTSMNDDSFKECWSLNNLRPYSAKQNIIDGNRD